MPGVAAVFTGSDLASDDIGPLPCAVTHIPIPRDTPLAQLYLDGPQIKNIAFEIYAAED